MAKQITNEAQEVFKDLIVKERPKPPTKEKYIKTPEIMWQHFCEYRDEVKNNPLYKLEQKKGTVVYGKGFEGETAEDIVALPIMRPLTMDGFELFLADREIITDVTDYFENKDSRYAAYIPVCKRIKKTIRDDQITGGMCNVYNTSITQRLNNLVEKSQTEIITEQPLFPDAD